jgi:hypothetical protein
MKKVIPIFISLILSVSTLALSMISANAETVVSWADFPDYVFYVDIMDETGNETYAVNSYVGTDPNPVIPDVVHTHQVKRLGEKCFYKNDIIETVTMHDDMTSIRKWAMRNCDNLKSVYFSKNLVVIYDVALAYNPVMDTALLRNTKVNELGISVFNTDVSLKYLSLPDTLKRIDDYAFYKCTMDTIVLPENVEQIGAYAFANSPDLEKIYVPSSVTKIDSKVFRNSTNVTVYCLADSYAQSFCEENSISYKLITEDEYPSNLVGDVNNDKVVDGKDAITMAQELAGVEDVEFYSQNCDVNGDCKFDVDDISYLQKNYDLTADYSVVYSYTTDEGEQTVTKNVTTDKIDIAEIASTCIPNVSNPYYSYSLGECTVEGSTIYASLDATEKLYTVTVDGENIGSFHYKDKATVTLDNKDYTFYVTGDVDLTSGAVKKTTALSLDGMTITDTKVSMELLATANVDSFRRMGVVFTVGDESIENIKNAVADVTEGTKACNGVVVHNSAVQTPNESGSYQFTYAPYVSKDKANVVLNFYTYAVDAQGNISVSECVQVDLANAVA